MKGERFMLRNLPLRTSSLSCSAANSVGTSLEFAAFASGPDTKYGRASAFCFFLSTAMVFAVVRTQFPRGNTCVFISNSIELRSINSRISISVAYWSLRTLAKRAGRGRGENKFCLFNDFNEGIFRNA